MDDSASITSGGVAPWRRQASCSGSSNNSNNSTSSVVNNSSPPPHSLPAQSTVNRDEEPPMPPPPPPPPPMMSSSLPSQRLNTEIGGGRGAHGPPSAIAGAMMKDKKPFTYTPGGIDLSEIRSPRMAKRIAMNAAAEGVTSQSLPQTHNPPPAPLPPAYLAAIQPQIMCPVLPQSGSSPTLRHHTQTTLPQHQQQQPSTPPTTKASSRHNHIMNSSPQQHETPPPPLHNHFIQNHHHHHPQPQQLSSPVPVPPPSTITQLHFTPSSNPPADSDDDGVKKSGVRVEVNVPWRGEAGAQLQKAPIPWLNSARPPPPSPPYVINGVSGGGGITQFIELAGGGDGGPTVRTTINIPINKTSHSSNIASNSNNNSNGGEQRNVPPGHRVIPIQIQRDAGLKETRMSRPTSPPAPANYQAKTIPIQVFDGSSNSKNNSSNSTSQKFAQKKPMPNMSKSEAVATLSEGIKRMASLESPCPSPQVDETEPRFKGGSIPSRAFKTLQNTLPQQQQLAQRQQQTQNRVRGEEGRAVDGGQVVHNIQIRVEPQSPGVSAAHQQQVDQSPQRYMGSNIPSRSFKILQAMTADEPPLEHEAGAEQKNKFNSKNSRAQSCPPQSQPQLQSWPNSYPYCNDYDCDQAENSQFGCGIQWDPIYSHWYYMWLYASAASARYFNNINYNEFQNYSQPQTPFFFTPDPQYHHGNDGQQETLVYHPTQSERNDSGLYKSELKSENGLLDKNGQLDGHTNRDKNDYIYYETENETTLPTCCSVDSLDPAGLGLDYNERKIESCDTKSSADFDTERMIEIENKNEKADEKFESSAELDKIENFFNFFPLVNEDESEKREVNDLKNMNDIIKNLVPSEEYLPFVKDKTRFEDDEACSSSSEISNISVIEIKIDDLQMDEDDDKGAFETTATFSLPLKFLSSSSVNNDDLKRPTSLEVAFNSSPENNEDSIPGEFEEEPCVSVTISLSRSGTIEPIDKVANQEEEIDFWGQIKSSSTQDKVFAVEENVEKVADESVILNHDELSKEEPEEEDSGDYVGNFWDIVDRQVARKIETQFQSRPKKMKSWVISESYEWRGLEEIDQEVDEVSYDSEEEVDEPVEKMRLNSESEGEILNNAEEEGTDEDSEMETETGDESNDYVMMNNEIEIPPFVQKEEEKEVNLLSEKCIQDEICYSTEDNSSKSSSETIGSQGAQLDSSRKASLMDEEFADVEEDRVADLATNHSKVDEREKVVVKEEEPEDSPCPQCSTLSSEKTPHTGELMLSKQAENLLWRIERFLQQSLSGGGGGLPVSEGDDSGVLTDEPSSSRPVSDIDLDTEPEVDSSSCQPQSTIWGQNGDVDKEGLSLLSLPENKCCSSDGVQLRVAGGRGRRYQRAKTHSRLFQLLQDENKDEDEEEEEGDDDDENEPQDTKIVQQACGRKRSSLSNANDGSFCKVDSVKPVGQNVDEDAPAGGHRDLGLDLEARKSRLLPLPIRHLSKLCSKSSLESTSNSGSSGFLSPISPLKPDQLLADMIEEFQRRFQHEKLTDSTDQDRDLQQGARSFPSKIFRLLQGEFGEEFYHTFDCQQLSMSPSTGANNEANTCSSGGSSTGNFIVIETETAVPTLPLINTATHYSYLIPNSAQYHYRKHRPSKIFKKKFMTN